MVKITGNFGKAKTFINTRIRVILHNTFAGIDAGKVTTGNYNSFFGWQAGYNNTTGYSNSFFGRQAGYGNIGGHSNNFFGLQAGYVNTSGYRNAFFGNLTGYGNTSGYYNSFFGYQAGYNNTTGHSNSFFGYQAGYGNNTGHSNNFFGYLAGRYETGNNKLFIDNQARTNEADGRIKALIYGIFDAATANQRISINARLLVREVATYADDATAGAAGLVTGEMYKHADGSLHIKL